MLQSKNDNEQAVMRLARHLTNDAETSLIQPSPYIAEILKQVLAKEPESIDWIVHELIREVSKKESQDDVEILREFLTSSQRKTLFDFLKEELDRLEAWSSDHSYYKKDLRLLFKGVVLTFAEQYEAAEIYFEKALQIDPTSLMGLYGKALALRNQGRAEDALAPIGTALKLDPENKTLLMEKAKCLDAAEKIEQCINFLEESKRILSGESSYYYMFGLLYVRKGNYVQARTILDEGIWIEPKACLLWLLKAYTFLLEENYSQAFELSETVLKLDPNYWPANYFIGTLHAIQKNHEDAIFYLRRAKRFSPDNRDISLSLIRSLCSLNNFDEAVNECDNLLKNNKEYAPAWEQKANIYFLKQDWQKVIEICDSGLGNCGDSPELWKYKGGAYDNLTEYALSILCYDKQISCAPDDATAYYGKGSVLLKATVVEKNDLNKRAKFIKEALECAKKAVELNEKLGPGWYIYALANFQTGDMNKGFMLLDKAAKLGSIEAALLSQMLKANSNDI